MTTQKEWIFSPNNNATSVSGSYFFCGIEFRFSLNIQKSGSYLYRGRMSLISPEDDHVLRDPRSGKKDSSIWRSMQINDIQDEKKLKSYLKKCALSLFGKYASLICKRLGNSARPETIIPAVACQLYAEEYVNSHYKSAQKETNSRRLRKLSELMTAMGNTPMAQISARKIKEVLNDKSVNADMRKTLHDFWEYCIGKGYCIGSNPVSFVRARLSPNALQAKSVRDDVLSDSEQEALYQLLLACAEGQDCGVALQWSGFSAEDACLFKWGDFYFDVAREDFVLVKYRRDRVAGTVHDYSRPVIPQCARILEKRRDLLLTKYSEQEIQDMPVVSANKNDAVVMPRDRLVKYGSLVLRKVGVGEQTFYKLKKDRVAVSRKILRNTYEYNLIHRCHLGEDLGTLNFLLGHSMGNDVTSAHYTSFTDSDAQDRLYTILRELRPREQIDPVESPIVLDDGRCQQIFAPADTAHRVGTIINLILRPGEEAEVFSEHGLGGVVRARECLSNGIARRKSPTRKR